MTHYRHYFLRTLSQKCHLYSAFRQCGGERQRGLPGQLWHNLAGHNTARQPGQSDLLFLWAPNSQHSTGARPPPAPELVFLHHTAAAYTKLAQGSLTQQCLSFLPPLQSAPFCWSNHCASKTNEDQSKIRGILKYTTQSHQNIIVRPDGPTLLSSLAITRSLWSEFLTSVPKTLEGGLSFIAPFLRWLSNVFINSSKWVYKLDLSTHKSLYPPPKYSHPWDDTQQLL